MNQKTKLNISIGLNIALITLFICIVIALFATPYFDWALYRKTLPTICSISAQQGVTLQTVSQDGTTTNQCDFKY